MTEKKGLFGLFGRKEHNKEVEKAEVRAEDLDANPKRRESWLN
jgi:hypothetical protein